MDDKIDLKEYQKKLDAITVELEDHKITMARVKLILNSYFLHSVPRNDAAVHRLLMATLDNRTSLSSEGSSPNRVFSVCDGST